VDDEPAPRYYVNPEIVDPSMETNVYQEGCLSVPEFYDEVERPATCRVKYLDYDGNAQILDADGLLATCIQHEMDHLNGVLFIDHLSRLKRDRILKKLKKEQRFAEAV
jgi:peptide deformylase